MKYIKKHKLVESTNSKLVKIFNDQLEIPIRKIKQLLYTPSWLNGAFGVALNYGFELNNNTWKTFVDVVTDKLSDEVEYEFTEEEYNNLQELKKLFR